jgi:hypothetical protein
MESSIRNSEIHIIEDTHTYDKQDCFSEPIEVPDILSQTSQSDQVSLTYRSTPAQSRPTSKMQI